MPEFTPLRSVLYMPSSNERALEKAKTIACDGHACWQAVCSVPSTIDGSAPLATPSFFASMRACSASSAT